MDLSFVKAAESSAKQLHEALETITSKEARLQTTKAALVGMIKPLVYESAALMDVISKLSILIDPKHAKTARQIIEKLKPLDI